MDRDAAKTVLSLSMDTNTTPEPTAVTVAQILSRYQTDCLPERAPRTQSNYQRLIDRLLLPNFGHRVAEELKPRDFGPFLNPPKGKHNRVRALAVLSSAFTNAVSHWYWIESNVLRDVKRIKGKPRDRLVTQEEFDGMRAAAPQRIGLAMMLAVLTGQRQGDILRFKWADLQGDALRVRQSKTGKRLAIEINPDLEAVLDKCWLLKNGGHQGNAYILPTRTGTPYTPEGFRAGWQRAHNKWVARGGHHFHFHDLRALAATRCKTPEEAMRLLGHTTLAMTMRVYRRGEERVSALQLGA